MSDNTGEDNPFPSPTAAVGLDHHDSGTNNQPAATTNEAYFQDSMSTSAKKNNDPTFNCAEQNTSAEALPDLPSTMWASFFRVMAESLRANETGNTTPKATAKNIKPTDVYIPSFDPDDCEFTAAQWCEDIDHHRTQNAWTDYETRNAAFTHLRGRARKWATKSYPLCKTWDEAKERLTRQFAATRRFHDLFRDMVQYTSDKAATYVEYSTNKLAMVDRLESGWSEANKIEVVISGISDSQVRSDLLKNTPTDFVALDRHLGTYSYIKNLKRPSSSHFVSSEQKIPKIDSTDRTNVVCHNCGKIGHYKRNCRSKTQAQASSSGEIFRPAPKSIEKDNQCNYCNKVGHTEQVCFTKQRDVKNKHATK